MKKVLQTAFLSMALLFSADTEAQLENGSLMPNGLVLTDINGNVHDLDALLAEGKALFIDVSATWCGPCWAFHETEILKDVYTAYGPDGTNEARVFFIEGDAATTNAQLNGIGAGTQGDWVADTPYPIVDDASAANALETGFFPTLYMICPSRRVWHISPSEVGGYWTPERHIQNARACNNPIDAVVNNYTGVTNTCGYLAPFRLQFQNKGVTALTQATVTASLNGNVIASQQWTGNLEQFQSQEISFGSYTFGSSSNVIFEVTPTGSDAAPADNTITAEIVLAPEVATNDVIVSVVTDRYKSESSWRIKRSNNTTVASSPSYGADLTANGTTEHPPVTVSLAANDCYKFEMVDSFGDGICCQYGEGSYTVTDGNGNVLFTGGQFGAIDIKSMSKGVTSIEETAAINNFSLFPNPSSGLVNVTMNLANSDDVTLKVYNTLGAIVHSHELGNLTPGDYLYSLDLSAFANGMYKVVAVSSKGVTVNSVQVSK